MKTEKRRGRPRSIDVRRYKKGEKGTRIFKTEDLEAEMELKLSPKRRGNLYVGTEFENCEFVVLVKRPKDGMNEN